MQHCDLDHINQFFSIVLYDAPEPSIPAVFSTNIDFDKLLGNWTSAIM